MIPRNPPSQDSLLAKLHSTTPASPRSEEERSLAENHARAAGTLVVTLMYGVDLWRQERRVRAAGQIAHALVLLPFSVTSWTAGAAGVGLEIGGASLLRMHRASFPLAWPMRRAGALLECAARGIIWCSDHLL